MAIDPNKNVTYPVVRNTDPEPGDFGIVSRVLPGPPINVTIAEDQPNSAAVSRVPTSAVNVQLVAAEVVIPPANPKRQTVSIYNDSSFDMFVLVGGTAPASATNFTVKLFPDDLYETPAPHNITEINAVWSGTAVGQGAQLTVESKV